MPVNLSDRRLWMSGALAASALLFYTFYPSAPDGTSEVEIVPVAERLAAASQPPSPEPVVPEAPTPAPSADGLRLHGLTATGAIIGFQGGVQRLVPIGRDVLPGLKLREVRQQYAILASSAGDVQLGFTGPAQAVQEGAATAGQSPAPARSPAVSARREETLQYRFGLAPRRVDGRITGFAVRPDSQMPALQRAGLRAGDVLVGINGQTFDSEERVMELATEIAGSYTAEFEFERNGRRMRASLPVNPRP